MMHPLIQHVKAQGRITIAEFMRLALMHPDYGYYQKNPVIGAKGDFITAPEISQIFGEMMGIWAADMWVRNGKPECALVELGPGRGTLMQDALRATKQVPEFHEHIEVHLVEMSAAMRTAQKEKLRSAHGNIIWHETIRDLPELPLLVIANEFFDALPIRQFERKNEQWFERMIGWDNMQNTLVFTRTDAPFDMSARVVPADAGITEMSEEAEAIMEVLCTHIKRHGGAMAVIDYGYEGGSGINTLQAVKQHKYSDMLKAPGESDITAHVDFSKLAAIAKTSGLQSMGVLTQREFLLGMGAEIRAQTLCKALDGAQKKSIIEGLTRLISPQQMGTLFKVFICTHPCATL